MLRRTLLGLAFTTLLAAGSGLVACAESSDDPGLNPQPLPPGDDSKDRGAETPAPETDSPPQNPSTGGASSNGDAGADASKGDAQ